MEEHNIENAMEVTRLFFFLGWFGFYVSRNTEWTSVTHFLKWWPWDKIWSDGLGGRPGWSGFGKFFLFL